MKIIEKFIWLSLLIFVLNIFYSCNNPATKTNDNTNVVNSQKINAEIENAKDSSVLKSLLIEIYKWHQTKGNDYYLICEGYAILGIDTVKLDSTLNELQKTDYFSKEFLDNYKKIGQKIDAKVRKNPNDYKGGYIYFPFQDYDTWYGGNSFPPNWDEMRIYDLIINNDDASFKWTCDKTEPKDFITVSFKREDNKWKLSHLQYIDLNMY